MKATINGKRYDSSRCETLAESEHHHNGNYAGTTYLLLAKDGAYLLHNDSNGQDCYFRDALFLADSNNVTPQEFLERCGLSDDQEKRLVELGLLKIVD